MGTPPEFSCQPTTIAPEPSWKSHPEIRRLRVRLWLLGTAGLLLSLLFLIASVLQARSNALLRARLSALETTLRVAAMENEILRRELYPKQPIPSPDSTRAPLSQNPAPVPRETSLVEPGSP